MVLPSVTFLIACDVFKSFDIVYIHTFSCLLNLSVSDNLALKRGANEPTASRNCQKNVTYIYSEMKTDLRLIGIVVYLVQNLIADDKIPIININQ